ncbi:hypothetical protein IWW41_001309 [Coemansia sp. RSA 2522]|nr:hypothetical protein IWW41_001309 [Coemansia sp. RSA 2522]
MIYAEDSNALSWDTDWSAYPDPMYTFYEFLSTIPLHAKKELFRSIDRVLGNNALPTVFVTSSQMRWAVAVIRLGMQLPIEDIDIIDSAFKKYSDMIFVLHRLKFKDVALESVPKESTLSDYAALEVLTRPSILFNPRLFFESDLPCYQEKSSIGVLDVGTVTESFVLKTSKNDRVEALPDTSTSYPTSPNLDETSGPGGDSLGRLHGVSSAATILSGQQKSVEQLQSAQGGVHGARPPHSKSQTLKALDLWDKYVVFLAHVLRVYSTMMRGLQPLVSQNVLVSIFQNITLVIDMILSQGGSNPRLEPWRKRYRAIMGAELWDATWAKIGDRLETPAIKLLLDVWGRLISMHRVAEDQLLTNVRYWLHRDRVVEVWMLVINQISKRVIRAHYPHDLSIGTDKIRVHLADFSMTTTSSDRDAKFILLAFSSTIVDYNTFTSHGYYTYACEVCNIVERILAINKVIVVDGVQYAQAPPTANYILYYFGDILFSMAMRDYIPSREYIIAKQRVIAVLVRVLTLEEQSDDKILPENRTRILQALDKTITKNHETQAILPVVPMLLKNSAHVRPFIPKLFDLVCHVLPKEHHATLILEECTLRHCAYEAMSGLTAFVGYYHHLKQSEMIADAKKQLCKHLKMQISNIVERAKPDEACQALKKLIRRINRCAVKKSAQEDPIFEGYMRFIFQTLLLSVATETDANNMQFATCIIINFLYQYSRYSPGYVEVFVHFYIDQLAATKSDQMGIVYSYGLMQTALVTWTGALSKLQLKRTTSTIVDALADCDKNLHRYASWSPYHQMFISSLRCLTSWISVLPGSKLLAPETLNKLVALLTRCNNFINCAGPKDHSANSKHRLRLQLVTSNIEEGTVDSSVDPLNSNNNYNESVSEENSTLNITAFTMLGIFGKSVKVAQPEFVDKDGCKKTNTLSKTLYRTLYTTIAVFSSTILRGMDTAQHYSKHAPTDVLTIRQAIDRVPLPETKVILKDFSSQLVSKLDGYVPTSIRFFSVFHRAIYTVINFRRFENGMWSDAVIFTTSRYTGGSKQWLAFPSMPTSKTLMPAQPDDLQLSTDDMSDSLPWIRLGYEVMYPATVKKKLQFADVHESMRGIKPQVDDDSEQAIEHETAEDFKRLHGSREVPDIKFVPAQPPKQLPRGNTYDRPTYVAFFGIDFSLLNIAEPILRELDKLDDLDRPFSANTGIIYLQSPDSLSTKRDICKGPLRGTSHEFSHFLSMLNHQQLSPIEMVKRHSDVPLLRYVFGIKGFKVCYNLAPNLSALISGKKMCAEDNREFYELLCERGIAVMWFDSHPGILDTDLAWQFIDRVQSYPVQPQRQFYDEEYLQTGTQSRASSAQPEASEPLHDLSENRSQSAGIYSTRFYTPPERKPGLIKRAIHQRRDQRSPNRESQVTRSNSEPGSAPSTKSRSRVSKSTWLQGYTGSTLAGIPTTTGVNRPRDASQGPKAFPSLNIRYATGSPQGAKFHERHSKGKRAMADISKEKSTESMCTFSAPNPQDPHQSSAPGDERTHENTDAKNSESKVRIIICLAPVVSTRGRLIKIAVSATGGSDKLNQDFIRMTGPLMSNMVVEAKDIAYILSATILDTSANMASLRGEDFSMVYKRMEMIKHIIEKYSIKHESVESVHKFMFPVGTSGVQSTFHINPGTDSRVD